MSWSLVEVIGFSHSGVYNLSLRSRFKCFRQSLGPLSWVCFFKLRSGQRVINCTFVIANYLLSHTIIFLLYFPIAIFNEVIITVCFSWSVSTHHDREDQHTFIPISNIVNLLSIRVIYISPGGTYRWISQYYLNYLFHSHIFLGYMPQFHLHTDLYIYISYAIEISMKLLAWLVR